MNLSEAITYGPKGNLTNDYYKGLQNSYNVLNRVDNTMVTTGTSQYINYIYDAGGSLIRKLEYNGGALQTQTDYIGGFVYLTQGTGAAALSYFPMPEGRVINNSGTLTQEFIITDGQGNARISFQNNGSGAAVATQETSYYGFGLQLLNSPVSLPPVPNKQLYNGGSEWQNDYANGDTNLPDYYQTFNRNYDAAIGRFVGADPDPESAESMTNYQYAGNMPIMLNDPDGDLLPIPGSHNPPLVNWQPLYYDSGIPADIQQEQDAFYNEASGGGGGGDFSTFWNYVLSAAGDLINGLNNSTLSGIDFKNPDALYNLALADPGNYDLSFSNGGATLTEVSDYTSTGGNSNSSTTAYYACNDCRVAGFSYANQGGPGPDMKLAPGDKYRNAEGQIIYKNGVVQNWETNSGKDNAEFIDIHGKRTELPGVYVSPLNSAYDQGETMAGPAGGVIYMDPANSLVDLEHEYGHYLDYLSRGFFYYNFIVQPFSLLDAWISRNHQYYWTEIRADQLAIQFFGSNSDIAKSTYYPH